MRRKDSWCSVPVLKIHTHVVLSASNEGSGSEAITVVMVHIFMLISAYNSAGCVHINKIKLGAFFLCATFPS